MTSAGALVHAQSAAAQAVERADPAPETLHPLTSLRFLAAFWVIIADWWPKLAGVDPKVALPGLIDQGHMGVEIFFVLSGFVLCHVYLTPVGESRLRYGPFLWARLARVYPMHLLTLAGLGLMAGLATLGGLPVDPSVADLRSLPANLLLMNAWGLAPEAAWNHPSWSISAEWFAYLSFPLFAAVAWRLRRRPALALALAMLGVFAAYAAFQAVFGEPLTRATFRWGALRIVPPFGLGCALCLAWRAGAVDRRSFARLLALVSAACVALTAATRAPDATLVCSAGLMILGLAGMSRGDRSVFSRPAFVQLGEASYSLYMLNIPWQLVSVNVCVRLFSLPDKQIPWPLWLILIFALVPMSLATHAWVEVPARQLLRRMTKSPVKPVQAVETI